MKKPICVDQAAAGCGEGPLWDPVRECLWWVDIAKRALHRFDPVIGNSRKVAMPWLISALALAEDDGLLIATAKGIGRVDPDTGQIDILHNPEPSISGNRLNDMLAAPDGALWIGTMSEGAKGATGALYRYGPEGVTTEMTGTTISNGLDWSPDGQRLYFIDSVPGVVHLRENGAWRVLRRFDEATGKPDGMTVDRDGTLWLAICDRGRVLAMTPEGEVSGEIALPCDIVTNCVFGGPDLKTLFVTTGTFSMSDAERIANPLAGGLFAVGMSVPGKPTARVNWPS
jgi:sugar lactone lactonase YvrE